MSCNSKQQTEDVLDISLATMPDDLAIELGAPLGAVWFDLGIIVKRGQHYGLLCRVEPVDDQTDLIHAAFVPVSDIPKLNFGREQSVPIWAVERMEDAAQAAELSGVPPPWKH